MPWDDEQNLKEVIARSRSRTEALCELGFSPKGSSTRLKLTHAIEKYQIDISHFGTERIDWTKLHEVAARSVTVSDILRGMGLFNRGNNFKTVKKKLIEQNIDCSHIDFSKKSPGPNHALKTIEEIFCVDSKVQRSTVRNRIIKEKLIPYECAQCQNNGEWQQKPITLQLEHKNGISNDNRLINLEFLCPNCHSQTDTWGSKRR